MDLGEDGDVGSYDDGGDDLGEPDGGGDMVLGLTGPAPRGYETERVSGDGAPADETTMADGRNLAYMARNGGGIGRDT